MAAAPGASASKYSGIAAIVGLSALGIALVLKGVTDPTILDPIIAAVAGLGGYMVAKL